ncbi:LytTR family transcriptional regulator DNA-binding domain-containing protein [Aequorivita nionensis]|uniref:LytTR family transcriptional regulator DNA-binding domain-containing protein n=1 Tax=Aequorivita nionensis TaxID=1287690 RepID=UPI003965D582
MFADITSDLYDYIRGAVLILSLYHFFIYIQNGKKHFLYYSFYFFTIFIFFQGQAIPMGNLRNFYIKITPSLHFASYIFYISFARELLNTKTFVPNWDKYLVLVRKILFYAILTFILITVFLGHSYQTVLFFILAPLFTIFSILSYIKFSSIKSYVYKYFIVGSILFLVFTNITLFGQILYGIKGFKEIYHIHPTLFMYLGTLLEAIVFASLLGHSVKILEVEKSQSLKKIDKLNKIANKEHIVLKNKSKVYIAELLYIKSEDHYLNFVNRDGSTHFVRGKLSQVKEELPSNFIRCHRSYIVNNNFIKQTNHNSLTLENKTTLPISKSYKTVFSQ